MKFTKLLLVLLFCLIDLMCSVGVMAQHDAASKTPVATESTATSKSSTAQEQKQPGGYANRFRMQGHEGVWLDLPRPDQSWNIKEGRKNVWNLSQAEQEKILRSRVRSASMLGSFYEFNNLMYISDEPFLTTTSPAVAKMQLHTPYVTDYRPTVAENFECMARQTGTSVKYDPTFLSKWIAIPPAMPLPYTMEIAKDWTSENRNGYVAHFPKIQPVGMDVYILGRYSGLTAEELTKVRDTYATNFAQHINPAAEIKSMKEVTVDGCNAIYYQTKPPKRPDGTWRQWSFVKDGQAFMIVSALEDKNSDLLLPQVESMVASFHAIEKSFSPGLD